MKGVSGEGPLMSTGGSKEQSKRRSPLTSMANYREEARWERKVGEKREKHPSDLDPNLLRREVTRMPILPSHPHTATHLSIKVADCAPAVHDPDHVPLAECSLCIRHCRGNGMGCGELSPPL